MLVSSAYIVTFVLCNAQGKSFMYIKNSSGPRHDPCGMPQFTFAIFDMCPFLAFATYRKLNLFLHKLYTFDCDNWKYEALRFCTT